MAVLSIGFLILAAIDRTSWVDEWLSAPEALSVDKAVKSFESSNVGDQFIIPFVLRNRTGHPVRILGQTFL